MSTGDLESRILSNIKAAMAVKNVSMTELSETTALPYRSLQNYLSGKTKMPVTVYIKICDELGIDDEYALNKSFEFKHYPFWDALWDVFGDGLLEVKLKENTKETWDNMDLHNKKQKIAGKLTRLLNEAYAKNRERDLEQTHIRGNADTTSQVSSKFALGEFDIDEK